MRWAVGVLVLLPLTGFPLFAGALVVVDSLWGEGLFLYMLTYEQRALADQTVGDFVRAMPVSYLLAALLSALGYAAARGVGMGMVRPTLLVAGAGLGLALGALLSGAVWHAESVALAVAGALFALALTVPLARVLPTLSRGIR